MPNTSASQVSDKKAQDALSLLEADHRTVEKIFDEFERTTDEAQKAELVRQACEELTIHTILEEEILYPAAKEALGGEGEKKIEEAYVEHFLVKTLIEKFTKLTPQDEGFDATFQVLTENVKHHVEEEEADLFPCLRKKPLDLQELGQRIAQRKEQLQNKVDEVAQE